MFEVGGRARRLGVFLAETSRSSFWLESSTVRRSFSSSKTPRAGSTSEPPPRFVTGCGLPPPRGQQW